MIYICPICNNKLKVSHSAQRHFSFFCREHYSVLFSRGTNESLIENEQFVYDDIIIQKVYFRRPNESGFFWSIRKEYVINSYSQNGTLFHITLSNNEFINKFNEFNPNDIDPIIERFQMFEVFQ